MSRKSKSSVPRLSDIGIDDETRDILARLIQRRIDAKVRIDAAKREIDVELNPTIAAYLRELGLTRVAMEDWTCGIKPWSNSHVSREKLADAGVHLDVIDECTVRMSGETVDVVGPKDKEN